MIESDPYIGRVLDEKYHLERLLGRGGMGAVYLATHLGTERYVALKLITPQFMRNEEFVARFKREARAAGRLRHPNVVDVTDFGFARSENEPFAYLVMEYLDGCTLADVLREEKTLPLEWVVDILEQVCSAVHEAHQQGIVHRDLKPENIWLEPNRLGGYRVKVLDFGIAKLAEVGLEPTVDSAGLSPLTPPLDLNDAETRIPAGTTFENARLSSTAAVAARLDDQTSAEDSEIDTLFFSPAHPRSPADIHAGCKTLTPHPTSDAEEGDDTLRLNSGTRQPLSDQQTKVKGRGTQATELTRVGAIMGTPLYMSPEQCAGKPLDARSDIYSLGVIAYQMLAGVPPFAGATGNVLQEHIKKVPAPLRERNKKVSKRTAQVVMTALAKSPDDRPQTAAALASALRAQAEGVGSLYRRAFSLYSEHFPKFLKLSLIAHLPVIVTTFLMVSLQIAENAQPRGPGAVRVSLVVGMVITGLLQVVSYFLAAAAISGMTAVIVTQLTLAPLRPVELRLAFAVLKRRWRPFIKTAIGVTLRIMIGFVLLVIPGIVVAIRCTLYAPVVLLEGLEKKVARHRARSLASRSWRTIIVVSLLQFLIPVLFSLLIGKITVVKQTETGLHLTNRAIGSEVYQQLTGLINIVIVPLMSIVPALLYLKMRQLGGEDLADVLVQIEEADDKHSQWQQRMRTRLSLPGSRGNKAGSHSPAEHEP